MFGPKQRVITKAKSLYGEEASVEVNHEKISPEASRQRHLPNGHHYVEVVINGKVTASSHHWNKSKAFIGLYRGIETAYLKSLETDNQS